MSVRLILKKKLGAAVSIAFRRRSNSTRLPGSKYRKASSKKATRTPRTSSKQASTRTLSLKDVQKAFRASTLEVVELDEEPGQGRRLGGEDTAPQRAGVDQAGLSSERPALAGQLRVSSASAVGGEDVLIPLNDAQGEDDSAAASPSSEAARLSETAAADQTDRRGEAREQEEEGGARGKRRVYRWYFKPRGADIFVVEYLHTNQSIPRRLRYAEPDLEQSQGQGRRSQGQGESQDQGRLSDIFNPSLPDETCYKDCLTLEVTGVRDVPEVKAKSYVCACCIETVDVAFKMAEGRSSCTWKGGYVCERCLYCLHNQRRRRGHRH